MGFGFGPVWAFWQPIEVIIMMVYVRNWMEWVRHAGTGNGIGGGHHTTLIKWGGWENSGVGLLIRPPSL
jgi:hypothetical protein